LKRYRSDMPPQDAKDADFFDEKRLLARHYESKRYRRRSTSDDSQRSYSPIRREDYYLMKYGRVARREIEEMRKYGDVTKRFDRGKKGQEVLDVDQDDAEEDLQLNI
jgi:hypothetical protein